MPLFTPWRHTGQDGRQGPGTPLPGDQQPQREARERAPDGGRLAGTRSPALAGTRKVADLQEAIISGWRVALA
eukprot:1091079-Prymnesium_polylepis.1